MDKTTRNSIQRATQAARKLLEDDYREQLEGTFDILLDGPIAPHPGTHLSAVQCVAREKLIAAIGHKRSSGMQAKEAVNAYLREAAFTTVNRFVALKMLEARDLVQECVSKGEDSAGFKEFTALAPGLVSLDDKGYRLYLESLCVEIGCEVKVLFDRRDAASLLWPDRQTLLDLLVILNDADLAAIWVEDETIGWVYQYFNGDDERTQMRKESSAPRNSRELAVRNQFFTPRYVVRFLTDNSIGRIWYEMTRGETKLADLDFLVRRPNEVFLAEGENSPIDGDAGPLEPDGVLAIPFAVQHRPTRDPRDLRILDPACGSGHFLLYAFELLQVMYEEAWHHSKPARWSGSGETLRADYPELELLRREIPALILRHNLYGVDIDPRAAQIAALALWMRAQRAYNKLDLQTGDRPPITKTNIVVAEPMPGDSELVEQFAKTLDPPLLGELFKRMVKEMRLAGDLGSLLKIEDKIADSVAAAREQFVERLKKDQLVIPGVGLDRQQGELDLSGIDDEHFFEQAEIRIFEALQRFAETTAGASGVRRRLFAEDAERGVAFVELMRKRFDVVLMNPPFGELPKRGDSTLKDSYPRTSGDLYSMFFERAIELLDDGGKVGVIANRTWLGLPTFSDLRSEVLGARGGTVSVAADLGSFVLEAQVETAAVVICRRHGVDDDGLWIRLLKTRAKRKTILTAIQSAREGHLHSVCSLATHRRYQVMPSSVFGYWMSDDLVGTYQPSKSIGARAATVKVGAQTSDDFRFLRLAWEVPSTSVGLPLTWAPFAKGGEYSPFFDDVHLLLLWEGDGREVGAFKKSYIRNAIQYGKKGITWPSRTTSPFGPRVLPAGCAFGHKGPGAFPHSDVSPALLLGVLASRPARLLLSVRLGAGDDAPGSASKSYEVGLISELPYPTLGREEREAFERATLRCVSIVRRSRAICDETSHAFLLPELLLQRQESLGTLRQRALAAISDDEDRFVELSELRTKLDDRVAAAYGFSEEDRAVMEEELELPLVSLEGEHPIDPHLLRAAYLTKDALPGDRLPGGLEAEQDVRVQTRRKAQKAALRSLDAICRVFDAPPRDVVQLRRSMELVRDEDLSNMAAGLVSWCVGVAFGHFDLRLATGAREMPMEADPLESLPVCSPGRLTESDGVTPLSTAPADYGINLARDGVLVLDRGHKDDLCARVRNVFGLVFGSDAEPCWAEATDLLCCGKSELSTWLAGSYFDAHKRTYSKSRRKAPIYWQLATGSSSYSVWLYYHRLTRDTLFRVAQDYVAPKVDHEERKLNALRQEAGPDPSRHLRTAIDAQETLVAELRAFLGEIERVAPLWRPDLDDGVVINCAPLWRLVPQHREWQKECKAAWAKLCKGDYDWARLAMHLWPERVVPKCAKDRSLAIAHGLEHEFWYEDNKGKWRPRRSSSEELELQIAKRSFTAVKAALKELLSAPAPTSKRRSRKRGGA